MGKFDGVLICTDLDGTLFTSDKRVSDENIKAIEYFKSEGGFFTFVTGRMPFFASHVCDIIHPNAPFGCINGGGLYDNDAKKYIWTTEISKKVISLIESVEESLPDIGIQVNLFDKIYFCRENLTMEKFRQLTGIPNLTRSYLDIDEPMAKIVFGSESDREIAELERLLRSHPEADDFDFVRGERTLFEILPKGIGKGKSIEMLCKHLGIDRNKTVAVGDYNNDIPMFRAARVGIAVSNACEEALKAADFVTVSNDENAIAQVISDVESGRFGI